MTLFVLTYLAGILTILAPCVLPILPIILAGSIWEKSWKRPFLITLSLAISIVIFTVLLKTTTLLIDVPFIFWKYLSGCILLILGLVYVFPHQWSIVGSKLWFSRSWELLSKTKNIQSTNIQSIATWFALGPVFSSCSPTYAFLLATIFPASFIQGIFYTFTYSLWLATILFIIAWGWQKVVRKLKFFADEKWVFKKLLGFVFIIIGFSIATWLDKRFEIFILNSCNISGIEQSLFDLFDIEQ